MQKKLNQNLGKNVDDTNIKEDRPIRKGNQTGGKVGGQGTKDQDFNR